MNTQTILAGSTSASKSNDHFLSAARLSRRPDWLQALLFLSFLVSSAVLAAPADQNFNSQNPAANAGGSVTLNGVIYDQSNGAGTHTAYVNEIVNTTLNQVYGIQDSGTDVLFIFNTDSVSVIDPGSGRALGAVDFRIRSSDGGEFKMASMEADAGVDTGGVALNYTVKGYRDGNEVASDTIDFASSDASGSISYSNIGGGYNGGTLTFTSAWENIDEVRFTGASAGEYGILGLDNLDFETAVTASVPAITAVTIPNTAMKVGDTVTATITVVSDADNYTTGTGGIVGGSTIGGFALSNLSKTNNTTYTATFTVSNGGTDVTAGTNIPISVSLKNSSGAAGNTFTTAITQNADPIDANIPVITAVSIPNATMNLGNTVTATITVASDTDTYSLGTSNIAGYTLSNLSKTNNTTYTATFTIAAGSNIAAGSDIPLSVVLSDTAGNSSAAFTTAISQNGDPINAAAYTVTYNSNSATSGTVPTDANNYVNGNTVTVAANTGTLARTGFTFAGWNTAANGTGTDYAATGAATFVMGTANVTLYAKWVANTYTVTYNANGATGGTVPTDANSYNNGNTVTVAANTGTLTRTGFTFAGWNTAANGTGTDYAATGAATFVMGTANVTLYAKWTANTYTVTYDGNGNTAGTVPTDNHLYNNGATVTVAANTGSLVRTGSTFAGWNTAANGTGTDYAATGAATFVMGTANVTLYAKWAAVAPDPDDNPFNPGGTQTENELEPGTGVEPTPAPSDIVTNLDQLDDRVGISDNGVLVILDNGLSEPVKFRDNPPDNVLIAMPSQKPLDVQLSGNTLNITVDPETPNPPARTILGTTTLLLPDGTQTKGLQLVQGEAEIGNATPGAPIGGLELSKDTTLRSVVAQAGPAGGSAGFRKTSDGAGSVSAEQGEVRIAVRLKTSSVSTLRNAEALTLPGFVADAAQTITDNVTLTLKAGEVARFNAEGELEGVFLGSLSGTAGKTGDALALVKPAAVSDYPETTLVLEGGNTLGRSGSRFSDLLHAQLPGVELSQRNDGLVRIVAGSSEFYARLIGHFDVVPEAASGAVINADGSLSLTYGGIRSTWQAMLADPADFAGYFAASGFATEIRDDGLVQVTAGAANEFYVVRPHRLALPMATGTTQGLTAATGSASASLLYTSMAGAQQRLDPAFHDEVQIQQAAAAIGWTLLHSGYSTYGLFARSPTGQVYQLIPDFKVEVLPADPGFSGVFQRDGQRIYFYYSDRPLRQAFIVR